MIWGESISWLIRLNLLTIAYEIWRRSLIDNDKDLAPNCPQSLTVHENQPVFDEKW